MMLIIMMLIVLILIVLVFLAKDAVINSDINPFQANVLFLYPLKRQEASSSLLFSEGTEMEP